MRPCVPLGRVCRRRTRCGCYGSRSARRNSASCSSACRTMTRAACPASHASPTTTSTGRRHPSGRVSQLGPGRGGGGAPPRGPSIPSACECFLPDPVGLSGTGPPATSGRTGRGWRPGFLSSGLALFPGSGAFLRLHQRQQQHVLVHEDHQRNPQFPLL